MTKLLLIITTVIISLCTFSLYALPTEDNAAFPVTNWSSKNSNDDVTINNGSGLPIIIVINVDTSAAGANIKNCGTTTHINPGSSAICSTGDSANPVTITSDSVSTPSVGTYQLKQQ